MIIQNNPITETPAKQSAANVIFAKAAALHQVTREIQLNSPPGGRHASSQTPSPWVLILEATSQQVPHRPTCVRNYCLFCICDHSFGVTCMYVLNIFLQHLGHLMNLLESQVTYILG